MQSAVKEYTLQCTYSPHVQERQWMRPNEGNMATFPRGLKKPEDR